MLTSLFFFFLVALGFKLRALHSVVLLLEPHLLLLFLFLRQGLAIAQAGL
jgi:hypothetical protein